MGVEQVGIDAAAMILGAGATDQLHLSVDYTMRMVAVLGPGQQIDLPAHGTNPSLRSRGSPARSWLRETARVSLQG